jgi:hypothetical protein
MCVRWRVRRRCRHHLHTPPPPALRAATVTRHLLRHHAITATATMRQAAYGDHLAHARLVTLAPELPGADKLIDELVRSPELA